MNRRGFLGAMLAAASAPAIVKAENLMKIFVPPKEIVTPPLGFIIHDWGIIEWRHLNESSFYGDLVSVKQGEAKQMILTFENSGENIIKWPSFEHLNRKFQ